MVNLEQELWGVVILASARYIHTQLNPIVDKIFPQSDFPLLEYINDDGLMVEPKWYCPIIPMVLVNGMIGIGTDLVQQSHNLILLIV